MKKSDRRERRKVRILHDERGVVSIFLIFVVMVIFVMMSVFIDYARVAAMEWRTQSLTQAASRSILSAYDPELQQRYGLFAYGVSDPASIAEYVFNDYQPRQSDAFTWIGLEVAEHVSSVTRPIGDAKQFEHQVLEEMKYKAPVQIAYELMGKMKPVSGAMKEAAKTTELLTSISKDFDKRNNELDDALTMQQKARDQMVAYGLPTRLGAGGGSNDAAGSVAAAADIIAQYSNYLRMIQEDADRNWKEKQYTIAIAAYEASVQQFMSRFTSSLSVQLRQHHASLDKAIQAVEQAHNINERMRNKIVKIRASGNGAGFEQLSHANIPGAASDQASSDALQQINASVDDLILPETFFTAYIEELKQQKQALDQVGQAVQAFQATVSAAMGGGGSTFSMNQALTSITSAWKRYEKSYVQTLNNIILDRKKEIDQLHEGEEERRRSEQEAEQRLDDSRKLLTNLSNLSGPQEHQQAFDELRRYADALREFNAAEQGEASQGLAMSRDPEEETNRAMESASSLYDQLGEAATGMRDRLYRNEYAFLYFTSYDPAQLKSLFESGSPSQDMLQSLSVNNQELEYIMYGFHNSIGNIAAAYGEIFAMRLAVRTMEGFVERAYLVIPLAILAAAIVYGLTMAMVDLIDLVTTNSIPLSKFVPNITLYYSDFLRLFMMLHGDRSEMANRMLALIQLNTGIDPTTRGTYAQVDMKARMKLWFLPGVMSMLGQTGLLGGRVENGYYEVERRSVYAY